MASCCANEVVKQCTDAFNKGNGFACSESILIGFQQYCGMDPAIVPRLATPFGGGVAGHGYNCGALQASFMVLGWKYGRMSQDENRAVLYAKVDRIMERFQKEYGTILCGEIRRLPKFLQDPEKIKNLKDAYHENVCHDLVANVAAWLLEEL